jgi:hypothetical protein
MKTVHLMVGAPGNLPLYAERGDYFLDLQDGELLLYVGLSPYYFDTREQKRDAMDYALLRTHSLRLLLPHVLDWDHVRYLGKHPVGFMNLKT